MTEKDSLDKVIKQWKSFLLDSNEKIHTDDEGVVSAESLVMNNFIVSWFMDFEKEIRKVTRIPERGEVKK